VIIQCAGCNARVGMKATFCWNCGINLNLSNGTPDVRNQSELSALRARYEALDKAVGAMLQEIEESEIYIYKPNLDVFVAAVEAARKGKP